MDRPIDNVIRAAIVAVLVLAAPTICLAQSKVPVFLSGAINNNDDVGRQLVFEIKEAIRGSEGFRLVEDGKQWPYIKFSVTTVSAIVSGRSLGTAVGFTIIYDSSVMPLGGAYITSGAFTCPRPEVGSCARSSLADIDKAVGDLQRDAPELRKTLK